MKPNPSQEFYDWLADEAIEVLIQDKELLDSEDYLSCDIVKAVREAIQ
jgi:hypothetical protein